MDTVLSHPYWIFATILAPESIHLSPLGSTYHLPALAPQRPWHAQCQTLKSYLRHLLHHVPLSESHASLSASEHSAFRVPLSLVSMTAPMFPQEFGLSFSGDCLKNGHQWHVWRFPIPVCINEVLEDYGDFERLVDENA